MEHQYYCWNLFKDINRMKKKKELTDVQNNAYKIFDPTDKHGVIDILPQYQVNIISQYACQLISLLRYFRAKFVRHPIARSYFDHSEQLPNS